MMTIRNVGLLATIDYLIEIMVDYESRVMEASVRTN